MPPNINEKQVGGVLTGHDFICAKCKNAKNHGPAHGREIQEGGLVRKRETGGGTVDEISFV